MTGGRETLTALICPDCGWRTSGKFERCPVCHGRLQPRTGGGIHTPAQADSHTFSLSTLFLIMTLICVGVGTIVAAPGLGIPLVVIVIPAFFRTSAARRTASRAGEWTIGNRIAMFAGSLGVMLLIGIAGFIAFQIACSTSCFGTMATGAGETAFIIGITVGAVAGLGTIGWLIWKTWPTRV